MVRLCRPGPSADHSLLDGLSAFELHRDAELGEPRKQEEIDPAIEQAGKWMAQYKVPVVIEIILEQMTNISMGTEIDNITEFEELARNREDAPSAVGLLD